MKNIEFDVIIDLRSKKDFTEDMLFYSQKNLEVINLDFFEAPKEVDKLDKTKSYLVVCDTGMFSDIIAKVMQSKGFKNVKSLNGGIKNLKKLLNEKE